MPTDNPEGSRTQSNFARYFYLAAAISVFLMMVVGTIIRTQSGAGLACPDWPTCLGQWGLPAGMAARLEYAHRALVGLSGLLILTSLWMGFRAPWRDPWIRRPLALSGGCFLVDIALGAGRVLSPSVFGSLQPAHMGLALLSLGMLTAVTVSAFSPSRNPATPRSFSWRTSSPFTRLSLLTLGGVFLVTLSGLALSQIQGIRQVGIILAGTTLSYFQLAHLVVTGLTGVGVLALYISAWRTQKTQVVLLSAASSVAVLFSGQILLGQAKIRQGFPLDLVGLHAAVSIGLWAALVVLVTAALRAGRTAEDERRDALEWVNQPGRWRDFLTLTKPIIVALLLVTTYAGMVVGGRGLPAVGLTFWTLLAGAMAAGGSGAVNQYIDRELDGRMQRTAKRPLASGRLTPAEGLAFGLILLFGSFFLMAVFVNLLAAVLSLAGMVYYVLLYSILLKKATVQNIVIGGGAGAIPPLVGWAAATGRLDIPALFLFAIVFLWTPPHFWALALVRRKDYARAGVPMLPVVRGEQVTRVQIFIYTLELVGLTLLMPLFRLTGSVFLISALVLGGALIFQAWRVLRQGGNKTAWMMYRYSSMYLAFIFLALVVDVFI